MLTALAAEGPTLDAVPAERFGRAPYFVLVEDGNLVEAIPNQEAQGSSGVGGRVVMQLVQKGVRRVVAPQFGPKAQTALDAAGIEALPLTGGPTLKELVASLETRG